MNTTLLFSADISYNALYQPIIQKTIPGMFPVLNPSMKFLRKPKLSEMRKTRTK